MKKRYFEKIPTAKVLSVSQSNLMKSFKEIENDYGKFLEKIGIPLPKSETTKWYQLSILKHFQCLAIHKNDISILIANLTSTTATDQQVRHLKTQDGWFVLNRGDSYKNKYVPDGCHVLITTKSPIPNSTLQRRTVVAARDWEEILKKYHYACASCGTKVKERHRFDESFVVETLEKGHMNPHKPLEAGNIIPQCRWCNRTARSDFVFDEQGRPRAVANVRPVKRAEKEVIEKIKNWLLGSEK